MLHGVMIDKKLFEEGQKILFRDMYTRQDQIGEIKFGIYGDDEDYSTHEHFGWYVEFISYNHTVIKTLPDVVRICHGEVIHE